MLGLYSTAYGKVIYSRQIEESRVMYSGPVEDSRVIIYYCIVGLYTVGQ